MRDFFKVLHRTEIPDQCAVELLQTPAGRRRFQVRYGAVLRKDLTYAEAAKEYGECVMHALSCAGLVHTDGA